VSPEPRKIRVGDFLDANGAPIDAGVAIYFARPHSYTGEDVLELQGHGGPAVMRLTLERCIELGARIAEPGEFTERAFLNDKLDLAQAEAVADLIDASTEYAARAAVRSMKGEFSAIVAQIQSQLTELRALIEATLDFPDEGIDALGRADVEARFVHIIDDIRAVLLRARQGQLLRDGISIAIVGLPNVGKSSIINALSNDEVAIVTPIAGTTRDLVRQVVDIRGVPVHIIDTAGVRQPQDPVEAFGIAKTWSTIAQADLVLLVSDAAVEDSAGLQEIQARIPTNTPVLRVHNKIDLIGGVSGVDQDADVATVWISAKHGDGLATLEERILALCGWQAGEGNTYIARARHLEALRICESQVLAANALMDQSELMAEELRAAQRSLSQLTGEFAADDLLGEIFSRFCIGK
jgi:tRNA modification GTPase